VQPLTKLVSDFGAHGFSLHGFTQHFTHTCPSSFYLLHGNGHRSARSKITSLLYYFGTVNTIIKKIAHTLILDRAGKNRTQTVEIQIQLVKNYQRRKKCGTF
jgi:hypothetical protein